MVKERFCIEIERGLKQRALLEKIQELSSKELEIKLNMIGNDVRRGYTLEYKVKRRIFSDNLFTIFPYPNPFRGNETGIHISVWRKEGLSLTRKIAELIEDQLSLEVAIDKMYV